MKSRILKILAEAVWAPSGDNSQPWSFKISENVVDIFAHPEKDHPLLNVDSRGTLLAIGALAENIVICSPAQGLSAKVEGLRDARVVRVVFSEATTITHPLAHAVRERHTNRGPYTDVPPSSEFLSFLEEVAKSYPPCAVRVVSEREKVQRIAKAASMMEKTALLTPELHRLFFESIIWEKDKNIRGEEGLYIKAMELPAPVQLLFGALRSWRVTRALNKLGFASAAAASNARTYARTGAMLAVVVPDMSPKTVIMAGRGMQRIWLEAVAHGFAAQPLAGLLYAAQYVKAGGSIIDRKLASEVLEAKEAIHDSFGIKSGEVAMMLRVGTPLRPSSARSGRRAPVLQT